MSISSYIFLKNFSIFLMMTDFVKNKWQNNAGMAKNHLMCHLYHLKTGSIVATSFFSMFSSSTFSFFCFFAYCLITSKDVSWKIKSPKQAWRRRRRWPRNGKRGAYRPSATIGFWDLMLLVFTGIYRVKNKGFSPSPV